MNKEQLIEQGLSEEQADKVLEMHSETLKGFIPKTRFDEVNETKKDLEKQIEERDTQLKNLNNKVKGNEELEETIKELQEINKTTKEEYETRIKNMNIQSAIRSKLTDAKYPDLIETKFDLEKVTVADDGTVSGIDEQLSTIKEQYKDLFVPTVKGKEPSNPGTIGKGAITKEQFKEMGYLDRLKLKQDNTELYNKLNE